ncbi:MAG: choice-of-anchor D domain-containing protein, partial [Dermatophilaceae bacterium]|nr:choice-of-anchor D domain-containing protein [Dermatophilaceae bacterium]
PATGFPSSYTDGNGLSLQPCLDGLPICSTTAAGLLAADGSGEGFYFVANASLNDAAVSFRYHSALEGAWFAPPDPTGAVNNRQTFARTQISVPKGGLVPNAAYTVTDPWGSIVCTADANGFLLNTAKGCRTQTTAVAGNFTNALGGRIGPFLTWDTFGQAAGGPPAGYIGDFVTPHVVTGSPTGFNKVRIQGPGLTSSCAGAAGPIASCVETDLFTIQGKVQPGASAAISSSSLDFGNVPATPPVTKSVTYSNTSTDGTSVNITAIAPSAGTSADYGVGGTCTVGLLAPGASCTVSVTYTPTGVSPDTGSVVVSSDTPTIGDRTITLTGKSVGIPFIETPAPPAALVFGNQSQGTTSPENIVVVGNTGVANLTLVSRALLGTGAGHFSLVGTTNTCGTIGADPGAGCETGVAFAPTTPGLKNATLRLTFSDGSVLDVPLTGSGVAAVAPDAPTSVTATAGNAAASVAWTAPVNTGTSAITGYTVQAFDGATAVGTPLSVAATAVSATVSGLTNGTTYTLQVRAVSAVGASPAGVSNAVVPIAPAPPGTPTGVTATAGNATVSVTWTAPVDTGTSAITGYTVQAFDGATVAGTPLSVVATARSATVSGLTNGTSYTVHVTAVNAVGASPAGVSNAVTPQAPPLPGTPTGVTATRGNASATVRWVAPTTGGAVTGYQVKVSTGGVQVGALRAAASTARSLVITGLRNGTTYSLQVRAVSAGGAGAFSAAASVRPLTTPRAPVIGTATPGVAGGTITARATWAAPASNGGTAITGYRVRALRMSSTGAVLGTTTSAVQPSTARALTMTLPVLGQYRFTVQAVNAVGSGALSARSNLVAGR